MKVLHSVFIAIVIICISTTSTEAQTADEIINKSVNAIGGKDVLSKVKSVYLEGTAEAMGTNHPTNTTILAGKGFKNITDLGGAKIIQCFTDTSGWSLNPMTGQNKPTVLSASAVARGKSSLYIGGELFNYKSKGFSDSLAGREIYNSVNTYKIILTKPGVEVDYLIDPSTFYVLKKVIKFSTDGKDETTTRTYSNYKKTDIGYVVPYTIGLANFGYDITVTYTKVEVNKEVDPKIFELPK